MRERRVFELEEIWLCAEELERDVLPTVVACCAAILLLRDANRFAEDEGVCVVELELGGIFEVGFGGMQDHEEEVGLEELKERVAFEDDVDGRGRFVCGLGGAASRSRDFVECGAKERHAFGEEALLGAEPETALRAGGEEA